MMRSGKEIEKLFEAFNNLNVLVAGDVMIDAYLWGKVERISPEAPVPIVSVNRRENLLGGAANVALNLKALGANPILCSVIGNDARGDEFMQLLAKEGLDTSGICRSDARITTTKFRIIGNNAQMLRVDEEIDTEINSADTAKLLEVITRIIEQPGTAVIILQDYNKGVLTPQSISRIIEVAHKKNIPVAADPKKANFEIYRGISLFKPNLKELREGLRMDIEPGNTSQLLNAINQLHEHQSIETVLTTLSESGVLISRHKDGQPREVVNLPAHLRSIADVSGAGDTVISVASLCLALGTSLHELAAIANLAGGLVCEHIGVVPVNKEKLLAETLALANR
ncbi:MAG TPA: bifunctional ADP-heptose synthase [Bacteroidales bacterium]|jgi:ADP-heptose synthase, bifunctional sugar kinase/adenylyltransferase